VVGTDAGIRVPRVRLQYPVFTIRGRAADRPGLTEALNFVGEKDVLTVWKLDRLGRSLKDLIVGLSPLDPGLPSGLYGEHEGKNAKQRGDEERRRQCGDLAHPGGIAQIEAMA
jgi:Resolvase, N terminal domain